MIESNKVYNCDCINLLDNMIQENLLIDGIITDPPYLMDYKTGWRKDKNHKFCKEIVGDNNDYLIETYINKCYQVLKDNTPFYCFCNSNKIDIFKQNIENAGFIIKNIIIWVKNNWTAGDLEAQFGKQYEMIIYANKGRAKFNEGVKRYTDVWSCPRIVGNEQLHQNQKPIELIEKIIEISTQKNDLIFDGFMGSFTTAVACHRTSRRYLGAEIDKEYFNIGNMRLKKELSQMALWDFLE